MIQLKDDDDDDETRNSKVIGMVTLVDYVMPEGHQYH